MNEESLSQAVRAGVPRSVRLGGMTKEALLEALRARGVQLNAIGIELFADPRFTTRPAPEIVELACLSVAELGFKKGAAYQDIAQAALGRGLVEGPLELGPHLRLAYHDQPEGAAGAESTRHKAPPGSITVASHPLDDDDSTPKGFYLRRIDGGLWLRGYRSWPGHIWSPEDLFVFARPSGPS